MCGVVPWRSFNATWYKAADCGVLVCEVVSDDEGVPEPLGEPSCVALGEDVLCCEVDCDCVRLSDATCEGVIVRVRPPETV